jgi:putative nucleic acid binding protein
MTRCPHCAEEIPATGSFCPHCGKGVAGKDLLSPSAKGKRERPLWFGWFVALSCLVFAGWCVSLIKQAPPSSAVSTPLPQPSTDAQIAKFSPDDFTVRVAALEKSVREKDWTQARMTSAALYSEAAPIRQSQRRTEPAVLKALARYDAAANEITVAMTTERAATVANMRAQLVASAIKADVMFAEFEANEIRANQLFKGKPLMVSGRIQTIGTDILGTPFIALETDNAIFSVQAMFTKKDEPSLANLQQGQRVVVNCTCSGKLGNVILRDCSLP